VRSQGYWKNHDGWPVGSMFIGQVNYTNAELLQILDEPVRGNDLIALAHQLIAAKLNAASGAHTPEADAAIAEADALIGSLVVPPIGDGSLDSSEARRLAGILESFNTGGLGIPHCN
jgi:hypothetical protein